MPKIVVSYRRADTGPIAGRIFDRLAGKLGSDSVFMDIDNIPLGVDFREHIQDELSHCDVLIVIIGPQWIGARDDGSSRLNDDADPVRIEVETAMRSRTPIIPILVNNAVMPKAAELPESMRDFAFRNAAEVDAAGRDFRIHMDRVIQAVEAILARKAKAQAAETVQPAPAPEMLSANADMPSVSAPAISPVAGTAPDPAPPPILADAQPGREPAASAGGADAAGGLPRNAMIGLGAAILGVVIVGARC